MVDCYAFLKAKCSLLLVHVRSVHHHLQAPDCILAATLATPVAEEEEARILWHPTLVRKPPGLYVHAAVMQLRCAATPLIEVNTIDHSGAAQCVITENGKQLDLDINFIQHTLSFFKILVVHACHEECHGTLTLLFNMLK